MEVAHYNNYSNSFHFASAAIPVDSSDMTASSSVQQRPCMMREMETWTVGSVTIVWLTTEADEQSASLH